jgi:hypothetical protein
MPWEKKNRPRKGRRKIGSAKRKARKKNKKQKWKNTGWNIPVFFLYPSIILFNVSSGEII